MSQLLNQFAISGQLHPRTCWICTCATARHTKSFLPAGSITSTTFQQSHSIIFSSFKNKKAIPVNEENQPQHHSIVSLRSNAARHFAIPLPWQSATDLGRQPWWPRVGTCLDSWRPSWLALPGPKKFDGRLKSLSWREDTGCDCVPSYSTAPLIPRTSSAHLTPKVTGLEMSSPGSATVSRLTEISRRYIGQSMTLP